MERWRGALDRLGEEAGRVRWRYGAFELDPNVPGEGVDPRRHLEGRYDAATVDAIRERLAGIAHAEGLPMVDLLSMSVRPNTFHAHRLLTAALADGVAAQQALADALFASYWVRGENIGDPTVLASAAAEAGMRTDKVSDILAGDAFVGEVRNEEGQAAALGITAVPTFVFDGRFAVSGAQPSTVLADVSRRALESE